MPAQVAGGSARRLATRGHTQGSCEDATADDSPVAFRAAITEAQAWARQCLGHRRDAQVAAAPGRLSQLQARLESCHPLRTRIARAGERATALRRKTEKARAAAEAAETESQAAAAAAARLQSADAEASAAEETLRGHKAEGLLQESAPLPDLALALAARADDGSIIALLQAARARLADQSAGPAEPPDGALGPRADGKRLADGATTERPKQ